MTIEEEKEILKNQLGFILYTIGEASNKERARVEFEFEEEVSIILKKLMEIENGQT
jgi:hypothetical protein